MGAVAIPRAISTSGALNHNPLGYIVFRSPRVLTLQLLLELSGMHGMRAFKVFLLPEAASIPEATQPDKCRAWLEADRHV